MNKDIRQDHPPSGRIFSALLVVVLTLAVAVRLATIFAFPNLHFPDEDFQLYEQGHRLSFGYGVKPWEFYDGIRSYVAPGLIAALFSLSEPVFGGPQGYLWFAQIVIAALSLVPVVAIFNMGRRIGPVHALLAGLAAATWFEIVYFASKPLTEALAADFILTGLALASPASSVRSAWRLAATGACLGLAAMLRIQLAPGLAVLALWICRLEARRYGWLVLGAAPALVLFGAVDWATWGAPFASYVRAFRIDVGHDVASRYGVAPAHFYFKTIESYWRWALPPMALLILRRLRSSAAWIGFAVITIAAHSVIAHKEYRFVFPATASLAIVAALGAADIVEDVRKRFGLPPAYGLAAGFALALLGTSAALAASPRYSPNWLRERAMIQLEFFLSRRTDLCGLALPGRAWFQSGGYAFLHRNIPLYTATPGSLQIARSTAAFNYLVARRNSLPRFPGYRVISCADRLADAPLCVAERSGSCAVVRSFVPVLAQVRLGELPPRRKP